MRSVTCYAAPGILIPIDWLWLFETIPGGQESGLHASLWVASRSLLVEQLGGLVVVWHQGRALDLTPPPQDVEQAPHDSQEPQDSASVPPGKEQTNWWTEWSFFRYLTPSYTTKLCCHAAKTLYLCHYKLWPISCRKLSFMAEKSTLFSNKTNKAREAGQNCFS